MGDVTRRSVIRRLLLLIGIGPAEVTAYAEQAAPAGPGAPDLPSTADRLSSGELEDLVAFAEVLVEGRALSQAERDHIVEYLEDRTRRSPEYLSLYRSTARTLERLAGRRVASLDIRERIALVTHHRLGDPRVLAGQEQGSLAAEVRAVRTRAARDLIEGYYRSPGGWAVVDYATFPGRCGDLTRYTRPES